MKPVLEVRTISHATKVLIEARVVSFNGNTSIEDVYCFELMDSQLKPITAIQMKTDADILGKVTYPVDEELKPIVGDPGTIDYDDEVVPEE